MGGERGYRARRWKDDNPSGTGRVFDYIRGDKFEGIFWKASRLFGDDPVVCKYAEGDMYVGQLLGLVRHGYGKYTDENGETVWDCEWWDGWPYAEKADGSEDTSLYTSVLPRIVDRT